MNLFTSLLSWLCDGNWPTTDADEELVVRVQDVRHFYTPLALVAVGDTADVHLATVAGQSPTSSETAYLLKIARLAQGNVHLDIERKALSTLMRVAGNTTYRNYLPELVDSFTTRSRSPRRINVFRWKSGYHTLEQVHKQHPALNGRHLAWIFKRLLTVLGFSHRRNIIHGAVLPCHVLIHAADHGLQLVGWGRSGALGQRNGNISACYHDWYPREVQQVRPVSPATDLFLAARCLVYLAGGDPVTNRMPEAVPPPMQRFLKTCLLESASMRPDDAWALMEDFDELLHALYGPPTFHELTLT